MLRLLYRYDELGWTTCQLQGKNEGLRCFAETFCARRGCGYRINDTVDTGLLRNGQSTGPLGPVPH